ncbi:uncharacterized protein LOC136084968 [Hydra vulgaris]|uniref:Uncharacterized protein LOC136084968 n=1 Tax=Hydra vulgaris TaxID=6087 RepID=A0ABM4CKY7_HYDVU
MPFVSAKKEDTIKAEKLANSLANKNYTSFWSIVTSIRSDKCSLPPSIVSASGTDNVCHMWYNNYSTLFNSVKPTCNINDNFIVKHCNLLKDDVYLVTPDEVQSIINCMSCGKAADHFGLQLEHYLYASPNYFNILSLYFSSMLCHGYMPSHSVISPVVKDKNGDISDSANYRLIALVTIFSKILEDIFVSRINESFTGTPNQFGFKKNHSTFMPVLTLKDILNFYLLHGSNMHVAFIDITQILWGGILSKTFSISNGVRQGGVLSPLLFNIYINDLSALLNKTTVGCCLGPSLVDHLLYADDIVLCAASAKDLQILLNLCSSYAVKHDIVYNNIMSQIMCFEIYKPFINSPSFTLSGMVLTYTSHYKYLAHLISNDMQDDKDILKHVRSIYAKANLIRRKFSSTQIPTKIMLFNAFCSPIYGCQLRYLWRKDSFHRLCIAYNNALRLILNKPPWNSASELFVKHGAHSLNVVIRKQQYSSLLLLQNSENLFIKAFVNSDRFLQSPLMLKWRAELYL